MAAGDPFHSSVIDAYLESLLTGDVALQIYAPGGYTPVYPGLEYPHPIVRSWFLSGRPDLIRQDGEMGRVQSEVTYIVTMMDLQQAQATDTEFGSNGLNVKPEQPYFRLGIMRLYELLHNRTNYAFVLDGCTYEVTSKVVGPPFRRDDPVSQDHYDVMAGHKVTFWVT